MRTHMAHQAAPIVRLRKAGPADLDALDADEVADWVKTAHGLIAAKLTRKARAELGLG